MALSSIFSMSVQPILPVVSKTFKCSPITLKPHLPSMITQGGAKWADLIQRRANGLPSMSTLAAKARLDAAQEKPKTPPDEPPHHNHEEEAMKTDPKMQQTIRMSTLAEKVPTDAAEEDQTKPRDDLPPHNSEKGPDGTDLLAQKTDAQNENDSKSESTQ